MTAPWTREHDALLARVAEGLGSGIEVRDELFKAGAPWVVPRYNTDLVAVVRAAEAWRKQDIERYWSLSTPMSGLSSRTFLAECRSMLSCRRTAATPAEALARALYAACLPAQPAEGVGG